jgi:hypothetical protein
MQVADLSLFLCPCLRSLCVCVCVRACMSVFLSAYVCFFLCVCVFARAHTCFPGGWTGDEFVVP